MRIKTLLVFALVAPLLAACDNSPPPAKPAATPETPTAATKPAQPAKVSLPADAEPLLGTWAVDLGQCGDSSAVTVITAASYQANGKSCDISLSETADGSFITKCGGDELTLTPVFAPSGEGVNVVVGKGKRQTVLRCER